MHDLWVNGGISLGSRDLLQGDSEICGTDSRKMWVSFSAAKSRSVAGSCSRATDIVTTLSPITSMTGLPILQEPPRADKLLAIAGDPYTAVCDMESFRQPSNHPMFFDSDQSPQN